ncbi:MAG: type II toxin-antitoxin system VapC family toxin [Gemmataceae bacterium]
MNLLLDTHALLWYYLDDPHLSPAAKAAIADPANQIFLSPASHWEVAIKLSTGKYTLQVPFPVFVQEAIFDNGFLVLPINPGHTAELISLPYHHRDPFDRLIVAQAIAERMGVLSADPVLDRYPIRRLW